MSKFTELIQSIKHTAVSKIRELAICDYPNTTKKAILDQTIVDFIERFLAKRKLGIIANFIVKKAIIPNISDITQIIYDLLKAKFDKVDE